MPRRRPGEPPGCRLDARFLNPLRSYSNVRFKQTFESYGPPHCLSRPLSGKSPGKFPADRLTLPERRGRMHDGTVHVIAMFVAAAGKEQELEQLLGTLVEPTRKE